MRMSPMVLGGCLLPLATHALPGAILSHPGSLEQRVLEVHNRERTALDVPPLRWNAELAARAQDYANQLAKTGQLAHASRTGRGIERENLNQGLPGWNTDQMMGNWLNEKRDFTPGTFPNVSRTGNWNDVGHYSQMIWPSTTDIGCGMAQGRASKWLVCRYSPGGNKDGKLVGKAVYRAPGGTKGPTDSAKSRQLLGTPGQSSSRSNLDRICNPPPTKIESTGGLEKMQASAARRKQLMEEIRELQEAIKALQAGLADQIKPSLLERLVGTSIGEAPSDEEIRVIAARLKQRMEEMQAEQERINELLQQLQKDHERTEGLCRDHDKTDRAYDEPGRSDREDTQIRRDD